MGVWAESEDPRGRRAKRGTHILFAALQTDNGRKLRKMDVAGSPWGIALPGTRKDPDVPR